MFQAHALLCADWKKKSIVFQLNFRYVAQLDPQKWIMNKIFTDKNPIVKAQTLRA
jgi:hypothetical protein